MGCLIRHLRLQLSLFVRVLHTTSFELYYTISLNISWIAWCGTHMPIWKPPMHGVMAAKRSIPLFFNANITSSTFLSKAWSASMKMKLVSDSFLIPCVFLISATITLFSVGEKGNVGKYPMVTWSKTSFETSLKNSLHKETLRFPFVIWT